VATMQLFIREDLDSVAVVLANSDSLTMGHWPSWWSG